MNRITLTLKFLHGPKNIKDYHCNFCTLRPGLHCLVRDLNQKTLEPRLGTNHLDHKWAGPGLVRVRVPESVLITEVVPFSVPVLLSERVSFPEHVPFPEPILFPKTLIFPGSVLFIEPAPFPDLVPFPETVLFTEPVLFQKTVLF